MENSGLQQTFLILKVLPSAKLKCKSGGVESHVYSAALCLTKVPKKQLIRTKIETDPRSRRTVINVSIEEATQN